MRRPGHMQEMRNGYGVADRRRNSGLEIGLLTGDGTADPRWSSGRNWEPRMKTAAKWLAIQES